MSTKVIAVNVGEDYDALEFENNFIANLATWQEIKDGKKFEVEDFELNLSAHEFDDVPPDFVEFVKKFIDEDHAKHVGFYIVK